MKKNECRSWSTCSAILCPLNSDISKQAWFPGEQICRRHPELFWVRHQHKLSHTIQARGTYFTYEMLVQSCTYTKNMRGINPEGSYSGQFKEWIRYHKNRKPFSHEETQKRYKRIQEVNERRHKSYGKDFHRSRDE